MRSLIALSVMAVTMYATSTANAATLRLQHKPFNRMSKPQLIHFLRLQIHHDKIMEHFLIHHPQIKTTEARIALRWVRKNLPIAQQSLAKLVTPAIHLALWRCIHQREAGWHQPSYATDSNGVPLYWGGLQMHAGWGYGTSYHASDNTPEQQMAAAERGYRASGYSKAWLLGQWYHPECLAYA